MRLSKSLVLIILFIFILPDSLGQNLNIDLEKQEYFFFKGTDATLRIIVDLKDSFIDNGTLEYNVHSSEDENGLRLLPDTIKIHNISLTEFNNTIKILLGTSNVSTTYYVNLSGNLVGQPFNFLNLSLHFVTNVHKGRYNLIRNSVLGKTEKAAKPLSEQSTQVYPVSILETKLRNSKLPVDMVSVNEVRIKNLEQKEKLKKSFKDMVYSNNKIAQQKKDLTNKGFNLITEEYKIIDYNNGFFSFLYSGNGGLTYLNGTFIGGVLQEEIFFTDKDKSFMQRLFNDSEFKGDNKTLIDKSYIFKDMIHTSDIKFYYVNLTYTKPGENNAIITAKINKTEIIVQLYENTKPRSYYGFIIVIVFFLCLIAGFFFIFNPFQNKKGKNNGGKNKHIHDLSSIDIKDLNSILEEAKNIFDINDRNSIEKAYSGLDKYLRLFLITREQIIGEFTTEEIILKLQKYKTYSKGVEEIFDKCKKVLFYNATTNEDEFNKTYQKIKLIANHKPRE